MRLHVAIVFWAVAIAAARGYVVLLANYSGAFDETFSVPVWQRTDVSAPFPALVVAEDIHMPIEAQLCRQLVVDLTLARAIGSTRSDPAQVHFWIFNGHDAISPVVGGFNASRASYSASFATPTEGSWTDTETSGFNFVIGTQVMHLETYRFLLTNVSLRGGNSYWLAVLIDQDRALSSTDFSINMPRWTLVAQPRLPYGSTDTYYVVDWHGNSYRDFPQLVNWTNASVAEPIILPFLSVDNTGNPPRSGTEQLSFSAYGAQCTNITAIPVAQYLSAPPARDFYQRLPSPDNAPPPPPLLLGSPSAVVINNNNGSPTTTAAMPLPPPPPPVVITQPPPPPLSTSMAIPTPSVLVLAANPSAAADVPSPLENVNNNNNNNGTPGPAVLLFSNAIYVACLVGLVVLVIIILAMTLYCVRRYRRRRLQSEYETPLGPEDENNIQLSDYGDNDEEEEEGGGTEETSFGPPEIVETDAGDGPSLPRRPAITDNITEAYEHAQMVNVPLTSAPTPKPVRASKKTKRV